MLINVIIIIYFILSIYFTIKYKFIQLKSPIKAFKVMKKDKNKSTYRTFMVSLASHIGTGNVVGITSALIIGGPGSLFWMWVNALFMSISFQQILCGGEALLGPWHSERIKTQSWPSRNLKASVKPCSAQDCFLLCVVLTAAVNFLPTSHQLLVTHRMGTR